MTVRAVPLALAAALLGGCATLRVEVRVLEPTHAAEAAADARNRTDLLKLAQGDTSQTAGLQAVLERRFLAGVTGIFDAFAEAVAASTIPNRDSLKPQIIDERNKTIANRAALLGPHFGCAADKTPGPDCIPALDQAIMTFMAGSPGVAAALSMPSAGQVSRRPIPAELAGLLVARRAAMAAATAAVDQELAQARNFAAATVATTADPAAIARIVDAVETETASARRLLKAQSMTTITGGGVTLAGLDHAFFVAAADERHWAPAYNRALGRGRFGSTDIAIKLNSAADFSVKGFVFDGRATAHLVGQAGAEALKIVAGGFGVPIAPSGDKDGKVEVDGTKLMSDAAVTVAADRAREAAVRAALFRVADTILAEEQRLSTAQGRAAVASSVVALKAIANAAGEK